MNKVNLYGLYNEQNNLWLLVFNSISHERSQLSTRRVIPYLCEPIFRTDTVHHVRIVLVPRREETPPNIQCYADDTQLYLSFGSDLTTSQDEVVFAMEGCVSDIRA